MRSSEAFCRISVQRAWRSAAVAGGASSSDGAVARGSAAEATGTVAGRSGGRRGRGCRSGGVCVEAIVDGVAVAGGPLAPGRHRRRRRGGCNEARKGRRRVQWRRGGRRGRDGRRSRCLAGIELHRQGGDADQRAGAGDDPVERRACRRACAPSRCGPRTVSAPPVATACLRRRCVRQRDVQRVAPWRRPRPPPWRRRPWSRDRRSTAADGRGR